MDVRTREILQLDLVLEHIARRAASSLGREVIAALEPSADAEEVERRQAPVKELITHLQAGGSLPLGGLADTRPSLRKSRVEGSCLDPEEWGPLERFLEIVADLARFRGEHGERLPALARLMRDCEDHADLRAGVARTFDDDGTIRDGASSELGSIRRRRRQAERDLQRTVERFTSRLHGEGLLQDNFATLRNGRHVVPVKASYRSRVKGIVHASSGTGETWFVEPIEFVEASNVVDTLHEEEQREIHRILLALTALLRPLAGLLLGNVDQAASLDGVNAMARVAHERGWALPLVVQEGALRLFRAHHPLLQLETPEASVPITMVLDREDRCLIFSGPNAGGKTTAMKTAGILSILAQCGCPIPAFPDSMMPAFRNVLADIGDRQDLQAGLSTFSGHMQRIREMWDQAGHRSLVLLDELGTGTDPQEGVALAMSLLEGFLGRARLTLTTSHLNPVKQWAEETPGVRNASFALDVATRRPTFTLRLDIPGASEALEIAEREGLPRNLLDRARSLVGAKHLAMGEMLRRIEDKERQLGASLKESQARAQSLAEQEEVLRARAELLRGERRELREKAVAEREKAVAEIRERLERLIAGLPSEDELDRRREALVVARAETLREQSLNATERRRLAETLAKGGEPFKGQRLYVETLRQWGEVLEYDADRRRLRVRIGNVEATVRRDDVLDHDPAERRREAMEKSEELAVPRALRKREKKSRKLKNALKSAEEYSGPTDIPRVTFSGRTVNTISRPSSMTLDLHGYRVEEALSEIDRFLDRSLLASFPYVKLCHGTGTGKLYRAVHEYLRTHPAVKSFRFATPDEGGGGVTVVDL